MSAASGAGESEPPNWAGTAPGSVKATNELRPEDGFDSPTRAIYCRERSSRSARLRRFDERDPMQPLMTDRMAARLCGRCPRAAFTLVELLVSLAIIAVLAGLLATAVAKARSKAHGIVCLGSVKQLSLAWLVYASDHEDRLPYNLGGRNDDRGIAPKADYNWVNNILNWDLDPDNTNTAFVAKGSFSPYVNRLAAIYRCPSDRALSDEQKRAGWSTRVRSYSMNAMVGDAGENSRYGTNYFNPGYKQFKRLSDFRNPSQIFVFLDEHPDSINDGYFLNKTEELEWFDLPASYHAGGASFSYGDGHVDAHRWQHSTTRPPAQPFVAGLPLPVEPAKRADYDWVIYRTSIEY